jgi:hypothetical protein
MRSGEGFLEHDIAPFGTARRFDGLREYFDADQHFFRALALNRISLEAPEVSSFSLAAPRRDPTWFR